MQGMSSSRETARMGFAIALTQLLRIFTIISMEEAYDSLESFIQLTVASDTVILSKVNQD